MSRPSMLATPCPAPLHSSSALRFSCAPVVGAADDTAEIEFTRALQHEFAKAKPRRRQSIQRKQGKVSSVTIFEDVPEDAELVVAQDRASEKKTLLGKPAQRRPGQPLGRQIPGESSSPALREVGQAGRRSSVMPPEDRRASLQRPAVAGMTAAVTHSGKDPRRRNIYVPNDDTTIMTIHPGAHDTDRLNDTFQLSCYLLDAQDGIQTQLKSQKAVRGRRRSLAVAPKRVPLHQLGPMQNLAAVDVAGADTGKENMLPDSRLRSDDNKIKPLGSVKPLEPRPNASIAAFQARRSLLVRNAVPVPKPGAGRIANEISRQSSKVCRPAPVTTNTSLGSNEPRVPFANRHDRQYPKSRTPPKNNLESTSEKRQRLQNFIALKRSETQVSKLQQYPVLTENLSRPELYEDGWLGQQEVSLSEVVNQIFDTLRFEATYLSSSATSLREELIDLYHQPEVSILYKRLQASLLYGALKGSRDTSNSPSPNLDIGLRKRFLSLWLDNYDEDRLRTAAEVVVGRQIPRHSKVSVESVESIEQLVDHHAHRRALTGFLETFLVSVSDVEHTKDLDTATVLTARWSKMMLRSLMLIWLLDKGQKAEALDGCLFKRTATKKSSSAILHALHSMLMPGVGDIVRVLKHMEYEVTHVQDPLAEVTYRVENIAVDFRDGILLTRLVEVFLYNKRAEEDSFKHEDTVTIVLPDTTKLESVWYMSSNSVELAPRMLSQHLKMPCLGQIQKIYNVQIALSALEGHSIDGANVVGDIAALDIVNGHREKTLSLLWSLVSVYGLERLVRWDEVVADIQRHAGVLPGQHHVGHHAGRQSDYEQLLKSWAMVHAAGNPVNNLTTSFADGKVYTAIVTSFANYIPQQVRKRPSDALSTDEIRLRSQLRALGCSEAFTNQISSTIGVIPSRETTITNLAFLASRLLPLSRAHHAAMVIQRAYRQHSARVTASRRVQLLRLVYACATVVQTRNRIVDAAVTLQRAWRGVLDVRIARLSRDVGDFQNIARGWITRTSVRQGLSRSLRGIGGDSDTRAVRSW